MQFNVTYKTHKPEDGYTKEIRKYAWLPTFVNDRWLWLERYYVLVMYKKEQHVAKLDGKDIGFNVGKWVILDKRFKDW